MLITRPQPFFSGKKTDKPEGDKPSTRADHPMNMMVKNALQRKLDEEEARKRLLEADQFMTTQLALAHETKPSIKSKLAKPAPEGNADEIAEAPKVSRKQIAQAQMNFFRKKRLQQEAEAAASSQGLTYQPANQQMHTKPEEDLETFIRQRNRHSIKEQRQLRHHINSLASDNVFRKDPGLFLCEREYDENQRTLLERIHRARLSREVPPQDKLLEMENNARLLGRLETFESPLNPESEDGRLTRTVE